MEQNLYDTLSLFRICGVQLSLSADAISINQKDLKEHSDQVKYNRTDMYGNVVKWTCGYEGRDKKTADSTKA